MNINEKKRAVILKLYEKGESIETLQILTGFSSETIHRIINSKSKKRLLENWNFEKVI